MNDPVTGGISGGVVAFFILGANWAKSYFRGENGTKGNAEARARELATLGADIRHLTGAVEELKLAARENQERIAELAGNVTALTQTIGRHYGP